MDGDSTDDIEIDLHVHAKRVRGFVWIFVAGIVGLVIGIGVGVLIGFIV